MPAPRLILSKNLYPSSPHSQSIYIGLQAQQWSALQPVPLNRRDDRGSDTAPGYRVERSSRRAPSCATERECAIYRMLHLETLCNGSRGAALRLRSVGKRWFI